MCLYDTPNNAERLGGQVSKGAWRMPWRREPMKDVGACDKLGLAGKRVFDPEISEWGNPNCLAQVIVT